MIHNEGPTFGKELESHLWHSLVATAVDAIVVIDDLGTVMSFNPAAEKLFGIAASNVVGTNVSRLIPHEQVAQHDEALRSYRVTGVSTFVGTRREVIAERADGTQFPVELAINEVDVDGHRVFMGTLTDITARKHTQQQLELSEQRLSDAQRIAKLGHWDYNVVTDEAIRGEGIYRILGVTKPQFKPGFGDFLERVHPDDRTRVQSAFSRAAAGEAGYNIDFRIVRDSGEIRHVNATGEHVIRNEQPHVFGTLQDITERKLAEQAIQTANDEKEVLLHEIHHRVKNNLQVIAGILTLQLSLVKDPASAEVLRSTEQRVRAMALVHERLYASNDLKSIDIAVYLNELVDRLMVTLVPSPADVRLERDFEPIMVDIDTALPTGLIVSELMTNGLKYGLTDGRGTLRASLRRTGNRIELRFEDEGPGVPGELDLANSPGLGLRLVHILTKQLRGDLGVDSSSGLRFTLSWPLKEPA